MNEKTSPTWAEELKSAISAWHKADPANRSIITIAIAEDDDGETSLNASIIGDIQHLAIGTIAIMNDADDDNSVGRILRMAAMEHLMSHAKEIGTIELNLGDSKNESNDTQNTETHE